ncbi:hypothetical protein SO694_00174030 [Aureococcus anophagefferens]|uniref:Uncharacterized protein n=1 Tax=Aureococcus anophagefferens TaxID=44056 RepID=A0ABR1FGM8_AURAN
MGKVMALFYGFLTPQDAEAKADEFSVAAAEVSNLTIAAEPAGLTIDVAVTVAVAFPGDMAFKCNGSVNFAAAAAAALGDAPAPAPAPARWLRPPLGGLGAAARFDMGNCTGALGIDIDTTLFTYFMESMTWLGLSLLVVGAAWRVHRKTASARDAAGGVELRAAKADVPEDDADLPEFV